MTTDEKVLEMTLRAAKELYRGPGPIPSHSVEEIATVISRTLKLPSLLRSLDEARERLEASQETLTTVVHERNDLRAALEVCRISKDEARERVKELERQRPGCPEPTCQFYDTDWKEPK